MKLVNKLLLLGVLAGNAWADSSLTKPIVSPELVFEEREGFLAVEAEHFFKQEKSDIRAWYLTTADREAGLVPDADGNHTAGAGGGAYLEILPDTRKNHGEKLIRGENFCPEAGKMAVLSYKTYFNTPGRYHVWARTHSTGTEDNGLHVGIDGAWPPSGQRMQWTAKRRWAWGSKQRTEKVHTGVPGQLFLDVEKPGEHTIQFSMREDGFEFDSWIMTTDVHFTAPEGAAPKSLVKSGDLPEAYRLVPVIAPIKAASSAPKSKASPAMRLGDFPERERLYVDKGKWFAVNPEAHKSGRAVGAWPFRDGTFDLTLHAVGEDDGQSSYAISLEGEKIGEFTAPLGDGMFVEGKKYTKTFQGIRIDKGAMIEVTSIIGSKDGSEYSRARWSRIAVKAADNKPLAARSGVVTAKASAPEKPKLSFTGDLYGDRGVEGSGDVKLSGEHKLWHRITLTLDGPYAHENDNKPNPFTDYRFEVAFEHESKEVSYKVPGFFAADGNAGETSAAAGNQWRAHFAPDRVGQWTYTVSFTKGPGAALDPVPAEALEPFHGRSGSFSVDPSDKSGRDLRGRGRLQYVGKHHLRFAGSGDYFFKAGADAPETFLAYADFDGTIALNPKKAPLKTWSPHIQDWQEGDPVWKGNKGKGMIGAINYLSGKGCNVFSFLPYNAGGDGDNVWPFVERDDKMNYDCSKLDQWSVVFDHGTAKGMYLHFKLQETEMDDNNRGHKTAEISHVMTALDGGDLGPERKLYCREMVARFGHNLALNWNLGEENTQSTEQQRAMADYIAEVDPYDHLMVVHTFPNQQDKVYNPLLGNVSALRGASLQNSNVKDCHHQIVKWTRASAKAGVPWVVAFDEPGTASEGMPPDPGYPGTPENFDNPSIHQVRKQVLWGTLLGGGGGVEYYFGYKLPQNDLVCEDWRSRDQSWDYCRIALDFLREEKIPFGEMTNADELVGNDKHNNDVYCYAKFGEIYLVYLPEGGKRDIELSADLSVSWFNPREGGALIDGGPVKQGIATLSAPDSKNDWLAVIR